MRFENNVSLANYTTFKMGGIVSKLYYPENIEDVEYIYNNCKEAFRYVLGGGSNIIANDKKIFKAMINTKYLDESFIDYGKGEYYFGCSLRVQKIIHLINNMGYGGIEYLISVPATLGGAVVMNAGTGRSTMNAISDYITRVKVYKDGEIYEIPKEECHFSYRYSVFQDWENTIILGAFFKFEQIDLEVAEKRTKDRLKYVAQVQDRRYPNVGSLFCKFDKKILSAMQRTHFGFPNNGVAFSTKKNNWILNRGKGTYAQFMCLVRIVRILHRIRGKECKLEAVVWE